MMFREEKSSPEITGGDILPMKLWRRNPPKIRRRNPPKIRRIEKWQRFFINKIVTFLY
jgi:hypothetical protein